MDTWENITHMTWRLEVPNGWLIRYDTLNPVFASGTPQYSGDFSNIQYRTDSIMQFISDPNHSWKLDELLKGK